MSSLEAGDLSHWFNLIHLIVTDSVVATVLGFGKKQKWARHSPYPQRAQSGQRERYIEMITNQNNEITYCQWTVVSNNNSYLFFFFDCLILS